MKAGPKRFLENAALAAASLLLSLTAALGLLYALCAVLGADGRPFYDNALGKRLWVSDPACGYRNRPFVNEKLFGGVRVRTNAEGFRSEADVPERAPAGRLRVVGMGDSVTWGVGVNEEDTFLAELQRGLAAAGRDAEVVNAAVVGFSTFQEYAFLQNLAAKFRPDVVLVNFCPNDWFPTENPFGNLAGIYAEYFRFLGRDLPRLDLSGPARDVALFLSGKSGVDRMARRMKEDPAYYHAALRALLAVPMAGMERCARYYGIRLIYLVIPVREDRKRSSTHEAAIAIMKAEGIEYIDLFDDLLETSPECGGLPPFETSPVARAVKGLDSALGISSFGFYRAFQRLAMLKGLNATQKTCNYLDDHGHLSRRGHRIAARAVLRRLGGDGLLIPSCIQREKIRGGKGEGNLL